MKGNRTTPTLSDVAMRAGVSTATVSRCLNSPQQVVEKTRARVLQAVKELGYSPNFVARAMVAKRTNTIGAIIPTMENAIFARGLQAFQEELDARGFTLLVASSSYRPELEERQIRTLIARGADGLLLIGYDREPAVYDLLDTRGVPALVAWSHDRAASRPSIGFDNRAAMRDLARRTIALGHRQLAMISAEVAHNDRARGRLLGVRDAMREAGIDPGGLRLVETPYGIGNGAAAFARLFGEGPAPSAIMCGNDVLAVGALREARQRGLDVPGDVSITGFDDIELAQVAVPALTTVHVPHREMGRQAAQMLIAMVEGDDAPGPVELRTDTRMRGSLAHPPRKGEASG